jgi:hypothetical protein
MTSGQPSPLEIQLHLKDGKVVEFLQRDPLIAQRILDQIQPAKIFSQRMIMIGEQKSLSAFPASTIVRIDLIGDSVPNWPFPNDAKEVKMISEGEFLSRYDAETFAARTHHGVGNTRTIASPNTGRFVPGQTELPRIKPVPGFGQARPASGPAGAGVATQYNQGPITGKPTYPQTTPINGQPSNSMPPRSATPMNGSPYGLSAGLMADQPRTVFSEMELVNGEKVFLEVSQGQPQRAAKPTALDYALYVQNFFTLSSVHARRRESGMVILNPAHFIRCTFYPGVSEMPPGCWNAERLD